MGQLVVSRNIQASPEVVFTELSDLRSAPDRVEGILKLEVLTEGPIGVGTRFRETRVVFKKEHTEEMEIVEFTPGRSYTTRCGSCGMQYESQFRCTPDGKGGTLVEMEMRWKAVKFMAKLMAPLTGLMQGTIVKAITKDLDDVAKYIERKKS